MFYCTLYQKTSGTDRVRLCLSFSEEQEAINAEMEITQAAKNLDAKITKYSRHNYSQYKFRKVVMIGHINCPGPNSNEIFTVDSNKREITCSAPSLTLHCLSSPDNLLHSRVMH